ncbi:MAG TPA: hypothetical protein VF440_08055 [Novosphingobium sp.]
MFSPSKSIKSFALATSLALLPAVAQAEERTSEPEAERSFAHQGVQYVYTRTVRDGRTILTGTADRAPFRFVVRDRYVTGEYNYHPVSFSLRDVKRTPETLAVR